MTVKIETQPETTHPGDEMEINVTTVDATGTERVYRVSIGNEVVDGEYVMASRQIEPEPEDKFNVGASDLALEAAAERFKAANYEVFGR